jgi:hypothetical protein
MTPSWLRPALLAALLVLPASAHAQLPLTQIDASTFHVDGTLREWGPVTMSTLGEGADASMRYAVAYDANGLYVGAEVHDDRMVRTAHPGDTEDAIVLTLATPGRGSALTATEIWLYAGQAGQSAAVVSAGALGARRRSPVPGATIVEAPITGGYTLEAFVPWAAVAGRDRWEEGRGSIRLRDVDQAAHPTVEAEPALAIVERAHLDRLPSLLPSGGEAARLEEFLRPRALSAARPHHEFRIDVAGDERPEHVMLIDRFVVVMGPGYQDGRGYAFAELGIAAVPDLISASAEDVTGDGKAEVLVVLRQRSAAGSRDLFQVLSISADAIAPVFGIEQRKETTQGSVDATVRVERGRRGQAATIISAIGAAHGLDATTLRESPPSDVEGILLPWGPVAERRWRWDGHSFAQISERASPHYVDPSTAAAHTTTTTSATPAPSAPTIDQLLAAFRHEAGITDRTRPTFDRTGNVVGTPAAERVVVYGRELVVVGPEFRDGTGWFRFQIPCEAADLVDVSLADLTGEGRAELLFRIRQTLGDVRREVLLVHMFTPTAFPAILTREIAREQGTSRIENQLVTTGGRLEIRPGTARGWSASTWPFSDAPSTDGVDLPLIPWRDAAVRFRFAGGHLTPE